MADADHARHLQSALAKRRAGQKLTREEERALNRAQREQEEKDRWRYYAAIPKKHWIKLAGGRQHKLLDDQARRYGVPIGGDTIDLERVVTWLHQFLADNAHKLLAPDSPDDLVYAGGDSPMLEKLREEQWRLKKLERLERERTLIAKEAVYQGLAEWSAHVRGLSDQLQREFGPAALELLNERLADAETLVERLFGDAGQPSPEPAASDTPPTISGEKGD